MIDMTVGVRTHTVDFCGVWRLGAVTATHNVRASSSAPPDQDGYGLLVSCLTAPTREARDATHAQYDSNAQRSA